METQKKIREIICSTILNEASAIKNLQNYVNEDFAKIVDCILQSKGRLILTGIGKSANIGMKIVSTLNSTGTPSIFMHAADAIHGDLGIIQKDDIILCLSKSGQTPEIKVLIPLIKRSNNLIIALVGNINSFLAKNADYIINCSVEKEACPYNLAPTTSTTAQLVMGDALAIALLESRGFSQADFARYHPGGALGKQLYLKVGELSRLNEKPMVNASDNMDEVIIEISSKRLGITAVMDGENLIGVITDGDLRRMLLKKMPLDSLAGEVMTPNPIHVHEDDLAKDALSLMNKMHITQSIVLNNRNEYAGIIHLHDLLNEGII